MKKISWIRTALLLATLLFAVLGGHFLYTGKENASPLEEASFVLPLSEDTVLTQTFSPEYANLTSFGLAFCAPKDSAGISGDLTVVIADSNAAWTSCAELSEDSAVLYRNTVSLEGVADNWYLDFPARLHLEAGKTYQIAVSAAGTSKDSFPFLCLASKKGQIPEITTNVQSISGADSSEIERPLALRFTYDVLVPARAGIFAALSAAILLCAAGSFLLSRKHSSSEITLGKFLAIRIHGMSLIHILFFLAITIAAVIVRIAFLPVKSNDYYIAYEVWINEIRGNGGLASLGKDIGDNPPLYMTLVTLFSYLPFDPVVIVKLPSCLFDFILALVSVKLAKHLGVREIRKRLTLYGVILLNPLTLLDSAAWGQCDSLYGSFILLTLLALCASRPFSPQPPEEKKYRFFQTGDGICLLFAVAISLKLQAVFFLPVLCLMWIVQKRNVLRPIQLLWVPVVYTASCIPMYLAGRSLKVMFKIYLGQANRNYGTLTLNYPNLYSLIGTWSESLYDSYFKYGMLLAMLLLILLFYQLYCRRIRLDSLALCKVTALTVLTVCFCLPLVHERYAYTAEMLLFVIMMKDAKHVKTALVTMLCTLFTYCSYLMQLERSFLVLPDWAIALIRLGVLYYLAKDIFQPMNTTDQEARFSSH